MNKKILFYLILSILILTTFQISSLNLKENGIYATIETSMGNITCVLYYEQAPVTVSNFVGLSEGTREFLDPKTKQTVKRPFYNGLIFHRIIKNFVIQAGCPLGNGTGGPGYEFMDEINENLKHDSIGILSMANSGPNTNGSQFFITLAPQTHLDGHYSVFGKVIEGLDILQKIGNVATDQNDKPKNDVSIKKINIIRTGKDAKKFDAEKTFAKKEEIFKKIQEEKKEKAKIFFKEFGLDESKIITTKSGLKYIIQKKGDGMTPNSGQRVSINYILYLEDGTKVDSSYDRNSPLEIEAGAGKLIMGFDEALLLMKEGEIRILIIPPELGYGDTGVSPIIPPKATLIFKIELLKIIQ